MYLFFGASCIISPFIVNKFGIRVSLVVSSSVYAVFVLSVQSGMAWLVLVLSALLGSFAGFLWVAQGVYLTTLAGDKVGTYNGTFAAIFSFSGIIGNTIAGTLISTYGPTLTIQVFFGLACAAVVSLMFIRYG